MRRLVIESWAGKTPNEIAAELDCHPQTIRIHLARFNGQGIPGLGMRQGSRRKPRLTEQERSRILGLVKQPPPGRLERRADERLVARDEQGSAQWSLECPIIALDEIRKRLQISPEGDQGLVIQTAKEQARAYMRQQQPFVWNATNVTRALREQLVHFFVSYGARVRIVYLDAPLETIFRRNRSRAARIPNAVMNKLIEKLDVPDMAEAHVVLWETME